MPAHPEDRALLVLEVRGATDHAGRLLMHWRDLDASLSPDLIAPDVLVLRRRRTNEAVCARVARESAVTSERR